MRVIVFGAGAIGSLMIHYLCAAGNDVTVVARSTYGELSQNGVVIRHHLQKKTTVDRPRVLSAADDGHYDIAFSVMQGQQQLKLLPTLATLDADLLVLVGNNPEAERCAEALAGRRVLFGFQGSAGHREGGVAVVGRLPTTDLTVGGLHGPAEASDLEKLRAAFRVKGYKLTPVDDMYGFFMYHIAEIMPYAYLCYRVDCDLKRAKRRDIQMIVRATKECFDYLRAQDIAPMPVGEAAYYDGGPKTTAMFLLYRLMSRTVLGRLMVSDHCRNGVIEMKYLDGQFEAYRRAHPGPAMPTWDAMRAWATPRFESI